MADTTADTKFNYETRDFQEHAKHPGFWRYALRLSNDGSRYEIRLDKAPTQLPIAA